MKNYLKSKWTSVQQKRGWRHFEVRNVVKKNKTLELAAVCDTKVRLTVDYNEISDRSKWTPGWIEVVK